MHNQVRGICSGEPLVFLFFLYILCKNYMFKIRPPQKMNTFQDKHTKLIQN